jgi:hypothetical protein
VFGFLLQWPTLLTLLMFPILVMYGRPPCRKKPRWPRFGERGALRREDTEIHPGAAATGDELTAIHRPTVMSSSHRSHLIHGHGGSHASAMVYPSSPPFHRRPATTRLRAGVAECPIEPRSHCSGAITRDGNSAADVSSTETEHEHVLEITAAYYVAAVAERRIG